MGRYDAGLRVTQHCAVCMDRCGMGEERGEFGTDVALGQGVMAGVECLQA